MNKISLNGTSVLYNNVYYINVDGDDINGDGSLNKPFATFDKAIKQVRDNDLIYFKRGTYNITHLIDSNNDYSGAFLYDKKKPITIYSEPYSKFIIDNPINKSRDSHAIDISNVGTKIIGFTIEWNVKNGPNYSHSIFGDGGYLRGTIYNCHFIIKSRTSFSYASNNSLKCINCQFDILNELESAYSGKTTFEKCTFSNISSINSSAGMKGEDNKFNVKYNATYESTPYYEGYGIYGGIYKWLINKFLIKQNNQYYTIKPEYYSNGQFQPLTLEGGEQPNEADYENFGFNNVNDLLMPIQVGEEASRPYDKLENEFEICMAMDKE
ncbi:hypothetical protein BS638_06580 [Clostridium tepidum]|uniref:Uncharacterized protein n=1 Tax=Clostridium tepidum TaxID=1962263 RepID=A0A1S9I8X2_9CLOT|nr:hypothetical protein [Clostridium tepidum]OOO66787.1 hypothetical protein BS638_06580 [Clostridium tepidum]